MPINPDKHAVLVVGGAGYIGSHMVLALLDAGYLPVVLDNLSKGHRDAVIGAELIVGDMADRALLDRLFQRYSFAAVMHFASYIEVGESVQKPAKYYQNNVANTLVLIESMLKHGIKRFIFSSTAAVYGEPQYTPIDEAHPMRPINPYGKSKRMVEEMLADFAVSDQLQYASLRYFNAAGADPKGRVGERHEPETHLIPIVLQAAYGKRAAITIYGNDYDTPDGTCVRDYVHVSDLCQAHLLALEQLLGGGATVICNLGTGEGYSVRQVIEAAEQVTGRRIPVVLGERRAGDPAVLVADVSWAKKILSWEPQYCSIEGIIKDANAHQLLVATDRNKE